MRGLGLPLLCGTTKPRYTFVTLNSWASWQRGGLCARDVCSTAFFTDVHMSPKGPHGWHCRPPYLKFSSINARFVLVPIDFFSPTRFPFCFKVTFLVYPGLSVESGRIFYTL